MPLATSLLANEPVAAVFAPDPYIAEDAADLVKVEIEELPVVLDASAPPGEYEQGRSTEPAIVLTLLRSCTLHVTPLSVAAPTTLTVN